MVCKEAKPTWVRKVPITLSSTLPPKVVWRERLPRTERKVRIKRPTRFAHRIFSSCPKMILHDTVNVLTGRGGELGLQRGTFAQALGSHNQE